MQMAVTASNGGLLRWQSGWATPIGRFQLVFGRELGVTFFGLDGADRLFVPSATPGGSDRLVGYRSMYFDLPVLEYRPFRRFSTNQSAALMMQLFTGVSVPYGANVILPAGAPEADLNTGLVRRSAAHPRLEVLSMTAFRNLQRKGGEMRTSRTLRILILAILAIVLISGAAKATEDPLPSWNDGPVKKAIAEFVGRVTTEGGPDFVAPAERIATFDNDGTLWAEQPMYFQLQFALDRVKALAPKHPEWKEKQPFKALLAGDMKGFVSGGAKSLAEVMAVSHSGMTTEEFDGIVKDWLATAKHPRFKRPYTEVVYQPMLDLLAYLRANGFKTFIVSGGGVEFMRAWVEKVYGIPPEQVVGSTGKQKFEMRDGKPVLVKLPAVDFVDDKEGKPIGIQKFIGRHPIFAFGNSDGDQQMLQWTAAGSGPRFMGLVHHTDAEREWAYDRTSHIGKLDKALDEGNAKGWTVVDMKKDWKKVFPFEP